MDKEAYELVKEAFINYYEQYKDLSKDIILKYKHSFNVANYMYELADRLLLSDEDKYLAKSIGLLHDLGRFEQLKRYKSFKDSLLDHAEYACTYLFDEGHIREFVKNDTNDSIIRKAISNHNKFEMDEDLNERELLFAKMIRDADKIDILYQTATGYNPGLLQEPSKKVVDDFFDGKQIHHDDVKNHSDGTIVAFAFVNDINFEESFEILKETDNFGLFTSVTEVDKKQEELFNKMVEYCNKKIGVGVCD